MMVKAIDPKFGAVGRHDLLCDLQIDLLCNIHIDLLPGINIGLIEACIYSRVFT